MSNPLQGIRVKGEWLETSFLIQQVESHLVFGPIARHVSLGYVVLIAAVIGLCAGFFAVHQPISQYIGSVVDKLVFLIIPVIMLRMSRRQQAILGWIAVKALLGIIAFGLATIGAGFSFSRGQADAWPNLCLGMIWIPGIEFVPSFTPHQRYVSLARVFLSIPCIYFGVRSGNWHW